MPDLHPGKGAPIGAAMASTVLYPFLVGSDIGCGIAVFPVSAQTRRTREACRPVPRPRPRAGPRAGCRRPGLGRREGGIPAGHVEGLGTVGRGNHFVELARIETVFEPDHASRLGLAAGDLVLIVHSGSRGLGERILRAHTAVHGAGPAPDPPPTWRCMTTPYGGDRSTGGCWPPGSPTPWGPRPPSRSSTSATTWSRSATGSTCTARGRRRVTAAMCSSPVPEAPTPTWWPRHAGPEANHSVAHGAGRKMSRADALRRGRAKHTVEELRRTPVGSLVVCGDRQLLFEEAPTAYKRIEQVIADLVDHDLATPVATTVPLVTYKTPDLGSCRNGTAGTAAASEVGRERPPAPVGRAWPAGVRLGAGPAAAPPGGRRRRAGTCGPVGSRPFPVTGPARTDRPWSGSPDPTPRRSPPRGPERCAGRPPAPTGPTPAGRTGTSSPNRARSTPRARRSRRRMSTSSPAAPAVPAVNTATRPARRYGRPTAPRGLVVVVDTERQFSLNRRIAMQLLRQRIERGDEAAGARRQHRPLAHPRRTRPRQPHPHRTAGAVGGRPPGGREVRGPQAASPGRDGQPD